MIIVEVSVTKIGDLRMSGLRESIISRIQGNINADDTKKEVDLDVLCDQVIRGRFGFSFQEVATELKKMVHEGILRYDFKYRSVGPGAGMYVAVFLV